MAFDKLRLSVRIHDRILKMTRTITHLAGEETMGAEHIPEAVHYRSLGRENSIEARYLKTIQIHSSRTGQEIKLFKRLLRWVLISC